jgi:hypothetical protein
MLIKFDVMNKFQIVLNKWLSVTLQRSYTTRIWRNKINSIKSGVLRNRLIEINKAELKFDVPLRASENCTNFTGISRSLLLLILVFNSFCSRIFFVAI